MPPLLALDNLRVTYPARRSLLGRVRDLHAAVDGVSLTLEAGESLGVVGESGSGKTTVGRAVLRLIGPPGVVSGSIRFDGADVATLRGVGLRRFRREVQVVFQDPGGSMNPRLRVGEIVAEPLIVHGVPAAGGERRRGARAEIETLTADMLIHCGMPRSAAERYPHQFSGGQRQRIAIARALMLRPRLIICDEPTSALDVSVQAQILNLLMDLQREYALAYLFISHDLAVVRHMCARIAVMRAGTVVESGSSEQIVSAPTHPYTKALLEAVPEPFCSAEVSRG
ncbi:ABC transporter ATP-binding protein [soil metagenome]